MKTRAAVAVFLCLTSCSGMRDETVTEANTSDVTKRLQETHDVTPEESQLVTAYLARRELAKTLSPDKVPPLGKTIGQIISAQRAWKAEQDLVEARRQAAAQQEAARIQAEAEAARTTLRSAVTASVTGIVHQPADIWRRRFQDQIWVRTRITNTGSKPLKGARIRLIFKNTFDQQVATMVINCEQDIAPGETYEDGFGGDYNQFIDNDRAIAAFDVTRGTVAFEPLHVVYADGSQVRLPEEGGAPSVTPAPPPGPTPAPAPVAPPPAPAAPVAHP